MTQETAVEWLIKKLQNRENGIFDGLPHLSVEKIYLQAKQMEEQQQDEFAIGFAEWMAKEYWLNSSGKYMQVHTYKELLEIYKKEQGL
jgi:hypothetical protein